jgi:acetyltransferase-like isoleucine patch superfamily enzyme
MDSFYKESELKDLGFKHVGKGVLLSKKAVIYNHDKIVLGDYVRVDDFCILSGIVTLGNFVHIAVCTRLSGSAAGLTLKDFAGVSYNSTIIASSDDYSGEFMTNPMVPLKYRRILPNPVVLERHALVASHCMVVPGVTIGEGSAIGAMSLVLKNVEPWSIYAGIPAKKIKERKRNLLALEKEMLAEMKHKG